MNNEQNNNILGGVSSNPTSMNNSATLNSMFSNTTQMNNSVGGTPISPPTQNPIPGIVSMPSTPESQPILPVNPIPTTSPEVNLQGMQQQVQNPIPAQPIPQQSPISSPGLSSNPIPTPELNKNPIASNDLKIEQSSPFDIGINNPQVPLTSSMEQTATMPTTEIGLLDPLTTNTGNQPLGNNSTFTPNEMPQQPSVSDSAPKQNVKTTNKNDNVDTDKVATVGQYIVHMLLMGIPIVGFIIVIIRAVSKKNNKNIRNFARAQLIIMACAVGLCTILAILFSTVLAGIFAQLPNNNENSVDNMTNNTYEDNYENDFDDDYNIDYDYTVDY